MKRSSRQTNTPAANDGGENPKRMRLANNATEE